MENFWLAEITIDTAATASNGNRTSHRVRWFRFFIPESPTGGSNGHKSAPAPVRRARKRPISTTAMPVTTSKTRCRFTSRVNQHANLISPSHLPAAEGPTKAQPVLQAMNGGEQIVWGVHLINEPDQPGERVAARDLWPLHGGGQEEEADKAQELCKLLSSQHFVTHCRALPGNDPDANHPGHKCQNVYGNSRWNKGNPSVQGQSQIPVRKPLGNGPVCRNR